MGPSNFTCNVAYKLDVNDHQQRWKVDLLQIVCIHGDHSINLFFQAAPSFLIFIRASLTIEIVMTDSGF